MKYYTLVTFSGTYRVRIRQTTYNNDNLALHVILDNGTSLPFTINVGKLFEGYACIDTDNRPWAKRFINDNELGEYVGDYLADDGRKYPVYKFNKEFLNEI